MCYLEIKEKYNDLIGLISSVSTGGRSVKNSSGSFMFERFFLAPDKQKTNGIIIDAAWLIHSAITITPEILSCNLNTYLISHQTIRNECLFHFINILSPSVMLKMFLGQYGSSKKIPRLCNSQLLDMNFDNKALANPTRALGNIMTKRKQLNIFLCGLCSDLTT